MSGLFLPVRYISVTDSFTPPSPTSIMSTHTIRLHRVLRSTPAKVYRAFLEPEAIRFDQ